MVNYFFSGKETCNWTKKINEVKFFLITYLSKILINRNSVVNLVKSLLFLKSQISRFTPEIYVTERILVDLVRDSGMGSFRELKFNKKKIKVRNRNT